MANKGFGAKEINLVGGGTPTISSPNNLNLNANVVAIGTDATIGRNLNVTGISSIFGVKVSGVVTATGGFNGPIYIDESEDDNVYYNIPWLDTAQGGNGYRNLQVDVGEQLAFNPLLNSLKVSGFVTSTSGYNLGIQSGGSFLTYSPVKTLNFIGAGVTVTTTNLTSGNTITINIGGGSGQPGVGTNTSINTSGIITAAAFDSSVVGGTPYIGVGVGKTELSIEARHVAISTDLSVGRNVKISGITTFHNIVIMDTFLGVGASVLSTTYEAVSKVGDGTDKVFVTHYDISAAIGNAGYQFKGPALLNTTVNPTLYLHRGFTYAFRNTTTINHPFRIQYTGTTTGYGSTYLSGSQTGTQYLTVPFDAPNTLEYACTIHPNMKGTFIIPT